MPNVLVNTRPLAGKVALVTGGSGNIAAAIARRLASGGASVALTYGASEAKVAALMWAVRSAGGTGTAIYADAMDAASVKAAVRQTVAAFGRLDILVNNDGIGIVHPAEGGIMDDVDRMIAVHIQGLSVAIQESAPYLKEGGRIINVGSAISEYGPGDAPYARARAAVASLTKTLARDLGRRGITINNIMPSTAGTAMSRASGRFDWDAPEYTLQRYTGPEQIAEVVAFLAMPGTRFFTNAVSVAVEGYCSA